MLPVPHTTCPPDAPLGLPLKQQAGAGGRQRRGPTGRAVGSFDPEVLRVFRRRETRWDFSYRNNFHATVIEHSYRAEEERGHSYKGDQHPLLALEVLHPKKIFSSCDFNCKGTRKCQTLGWAQCPNPAGGGILFLIEGPVTFLKGDREEWLLGRLGGRWGTHWPQKAHLHRCFLQRKLLRMCASPARGTRKQWASSNFLKHCRVTPQFHSQLCPQKN